MVDDDRLLLFGIDAEVVGRVGDQSVSIKENPVASEPRPCGCCDGWGWDGVAAIRANLFLHSSILLLTAAREDSIASSPFFSANPNACGEKHPQVIASNTLS